MQRSDGLESLPSHRRPAFIPIHVSGWVYGGDMSLRPSWSLQNTFYSFTPGGDSQTVYVLYDSVTFYHLSAVPSSRLMNITDSIVDAALAT